MNKPKAKGDANDMNKPKANDMNKPKAKGDANDMNKPKANKLALGGRGCQTCPMEDIIQALPEPLQSVSVPAAANDLITALENRELRGEDYARLKLLIPSTSVDIHEEIQMQNTIVKAMQSRILDTNGRLHEHASAREIATVITGFNSFLNLYLRSMEKIDRDKQSQEIETAILDAIHDMPVDMQAQYLSKLKNRLTI